MYSWNLDNLNGFDWYLYAQYILYDRNPLNLHYILTKAANFVVEVVPSPEFEGMFIDFMDTMNAYLERGNKERLEHWMRNRPQVDVEPVVPDVFKKFLDELSQD